MAPQQSINKSFSTPSVRNDISLGDAWLAGRRGHRRRALLEARRFQISLRSRCTAMLAGLRTLMQTRHGPDW
jgi:hypothetical protein